MKKLRVIIGLLLVAALLGIVSCGAPEEAEEDYTSIAVERPPAPEITVGAARGETSVPAPTVVVPAPSPVVAPVELDSDQQLAAEPMIVRTGDMALVVDSVPVAIDQITDMAVGFGGYVVSSNVWKENESLVGYISIRVAVDHFDAAVRALRGLAVDVTSESTSSKDVTEEYTDLSAKLHNLEATEKQLLTIMQKAVTVEDILDVQRELSNIRGDIEQTKARMQYLERTSATSLISVRLEQSKLAFEFTSDKRRGLKEGEKIQFSVRQIAGGFPPYSYEWDFGDGDTSTEEAPIHAYKTDGSYAVSLTVTDDRANTNTVTRSDYITVVPGWSAGSIASAAWNGMVIFGHVLANIFIWIGIFSPVWIVVGGIVYWWHRRRRQKTQ